MTDVKKIETAVCQNDFLSAFAVNRHPRDQPDSV